MKNSNTSLFLGLLVDSQFSVELDKNSKDLLSYYIKSSDEYLREVDFDGKRYLGKFIQNEEPIYQLELIETHIISLLKKLVPHYPYENSHLVLFAIPSKSDNPTSPYSKR
jgi:hypothetical protein